MQSFPGENANLAFCSPAEDNFIFTLVLQKTVAWAFTVKLDSGNTTELHQWDGNIGSSNSLASSDDNPLPEPMLIQIYVAIWHHWATVSLYTYGREQQNSTTVTVVTCRKWWFGLLFTQVNILDDMNYGSLWLVATFRNKVDTKLTNYALRFQWQLIS